MKKTVFLVLLLSFLAGGLLIIKIGRPLPIPQKAPDKASSSSAESEAILFYGNTCPHCHQVLDFLKENPQIEEKSHLKKEEVYDNKKNAQELMARAKECSLPEKGGIGVPFLYDQGKCLMGDQPIIDYLKKTYL